MKGIRTGITDCIERDIEKAKDRQLEKLLNPPGVEIPLSNLPLSTKPGTIPCEAFAIDRTLLTPIGTLTPRQSDSQQGPWRKCRRVKGGFRVTKRFVIWSP